MAKRTTENSTRETNEERARLLLEINNAVISSLDLGEMVSRISPCLRRIVRHHSAVLLLYDGKTEQLRAHALDSQSDAEKPSPGYLLQTEGTPSGEAFRTGRTLVFDRDDLVRYPNTLMLSMPHTSGVRSGCCVPLVAKGRTLGVLTLLSEEPDNFDPETVKLVEQATAQIAIAVENALVHDQVVHEKDRFEMLLEVSNALSAVLDLKDVLKITSSILRRHIRHDFAAVGLYDDAAEQFRILALDNPPESFQDEGTTFPAAGTPDHLALTTRKVVLRGTLDLEEFSAPFMRVVHDVGFRSFCCAPLISRDRAIGVLAVGNKIENSLRPEDGETIQLIANQIAGAVENAVQYNEIERLKNRLASEKLYLEEEIQSEYNFEEIVGCSPALMRVLKQIETVAPTDSCVLLYGETGTGKELFSRAIHNISGRRERTLVKLNCAAIPTGLLESELFGHEKGAFTGAIASRIGRFELAHKGTLLLDEIGDIPLELQPKLLRVLQESEFERLGSSRTVRTDVRLIAATNRDLRAMVEERTFRSDLYYRLNVFPIHIPPLRERPEDIPLLTGYFAKKHAARMSKRIESIPRESIDALCSYDFPGNVRELENFIERAVILTRGEELQVPVSELRHFQRLVTDDGVPMNHSLEEIERNHIAEVLRSTGGRIAGRGGAAEILDLPVSTLRHRMKKLGLS